MKTIVRVLMDRDNMTFEEAKEAVLVARIKIENGFDLSKVLQIHFGLKFDYSFDPIIGLLD